MSYWEEPKYNDPEEIDGPDDVSLPGTMHHMQAKAELSLLVREGAIDDDEAMEAMEAWRSDDEPDEEETLREAVDELEDRGIMDSEQAAEAREQLAG